MKRPVTIGEGLHGVNRFVTKYIKWLPTATVVIVVVLITLHRLYPPAVEWLGELVGLAKPSLASVLTLIVCVIILERLVRLNAELTSPQLSVLDTRELAYRRVEDHIRANGINKMDLLQFSGFTAIGVLSAVAAKSPKAEVRMLLMDPKEAACFDADNSPDHTVRISTAVGQIRELERNNPGFKVDIAHYDCPPAVSAVIFDDSVCISWYHAFPDGGVVRMRGHLAPALLSFGDTAQSIHKFGQDQFDKIWNAKAASQAAKANGCLPGTPSFPKK